MNSISRAITSRLNEISNKRHRFVGEEKSSDFANPSWAFPTTSDFNCYDPPELIISEEEFNEIIPPTSDSIEHKIEAKPSNISKKVTSVVRRLSPFGCNSNGSIEKEKCDEKGETVEEKKSQKIFKETREKVDRLKKSFKTNERQQLIDSDEEQ
ncbi:unnamed protein product [Cylicocyclus nassatus]|uniref:Uncharacterized protein n=1 Tax=Cylicocyclus nassatus TaxID=53992 RepID=A0AA36MH26_CYLNA|nr:unnamed protein product [Cylicocyclus nassatus]